MRITIPLTRTSAPIAAALMLAGGLLQAQTAKTPAAQTPASAATHKPAHAHKKPSAGHAAQTPTPAEAAPVTPAEPPKPDWPAYANPAEASVVWDSHGLHIAAVNSSLEQILKDVSAATGAKIEGLSSDQRVFGDYGPGQARDVLSQLLQGSGYNVIMIGDQGQGAPRQVLLSVRLGGGGQPAARPNTPANNANNEEDEVEEQPAAPEPAPGVVRPGFQPGGPPRSPQQIMQEMQQRQQQLNPQGQPQPNNPQN